MKLREGIHSQQRVKKGVHLSCSQIVQSAWMFVSDLFAASVPVIPFAFFPWGTARLVSLIITAILLLLLGVGRGLVGHRNVVLAALQTLGIATAAALAGFLIGKLVTR